MKWSVGNLGFWGWLFVILLLILMVFFILGMTVGQYFYDFTIKRDGGYTFEDGSGNQKQPSERAIKNREWYEEKTKKDHVFIKSEDGLTLRGYRVRHPKKAKTTILMAHDYKSKASDMITHARMFYDMGYDLFLPDARGHGTSEGKYIGFGWHERKDLLKWIDLILACEEKDHNIVLFGISMGGATVMMASGEALPNNVTCIIQDCGYTSAYDELSFQLKEMYQFSPFPVIPITSIYTKYKAGFSFREASALKQVAKNTRPILMIHGAADTFVPFSMLDELFEAANEPKEKLVVPGAGHATSLSEDFETYQSTIQKFLEKYV